MLKCKSKCKKERKLNKTLENIVAILSVSVLVPFIFIGLTIISSILFATGMLPHNWLYSYEAIRIIGIITYFIIFAAITNATILESFYILLMTSPILVMCIYAFPYAIHEVVSILLN